MSQEVVDEGVMEKESKNEEEESEQGKHFISLIHEVSDEGIMEKEIITKK